MYASPSQYDRHAWLCVLITEHIHSVKDGVFCVFLYILHIDYQNTHSTSNVLTFLGGVDILAGP